jgi:hypothetical protein
MKLWGLTHLQWQFVNSVVIHFKYFTADFVPFCHMHLSVHCYSYYNCMVSWTSVKSVIGCRIMLRTLLVFTNCSRNQGATLLVGNARHCIIITVSVFNMHQCILAGNSDIPNYTFFTLEVGICVSNWCKGTICVRYCEIRICCIRRGSVRYYLACSTSPSWWMTGLEQFVEWLAGDFEVIKVNLPQCHSVHHTSHMTWPGLEPGP